MVVFSTFSILLVNTNQALIWYSPTHIHEHTKLDSTINKKKKNLPFYTFSYIYMYVILTSLFKRHLVDSKLCIFYADKL